VADGTAGNAVISSLGPSMQRPNGRAGTRQLVAGDQPGTPNWCTLLALTSGRD
jgi:hypothetical protein